jgi:hypothetical protein
MRVAAVLGLSFELATVRSRLATVDEQQIQAKQRRLSRAGLVVALFMVVLVGAAVFAVINLLPLFEAVPPSPPVVTGE